MKPHRVLTVSLLLTCGVLGSCSKAPGQSAHTVDWYLAHGSDRNAMVERCANDPGTLERTPDCVNAVAAAQQADVGSLRDLPPMGLLSGPGRKTNTQKGPGRSGGR